MINIVDAALIRATGIRRVSRLARYVPRRTFRALHSASGRSERETRSRFALTFDCETEADELAIEKILPQLIERKIPASFAVIGELAEKAPAIYKRIAGGGFEILNHGYSEHSRIRPDGSFVSTLFYEGLTLGEISEEIARGHDVIQAITGVACAGFRTPHFGNFQSPEQLLPIYRMLADLGYKYSSSTTISAAHKYGYMTARNPIELPIGAPVGIPQAAFDSWTLVQTVDPDHRATNFGKAADLMLREVKSSDSLFVCVYFDPSHVADLPSWVRFLDGISTIRPRGELVTLLEAASLLGSEHAA